MAAELVKLDILPVIDISPSLMVFPTTSSWLSLTGRYGEALFTDAVAGRCPFVLCVMTIPKRPAPERFYKLGVVAELEVNREKEFVAFTGRYRAEVTDWYEGPGDSNYWRARVTPFEDVEEDYFNKKRDGTIVTEYIFELSALIFRIKRLLKRLVEGVDTDFYGDMPEIKFILDDFDNFDFNRREGIDSFVWNLLAGIPEASSNKKQSILRTNLLTKRLGMITELLAENIAIFVNEHGNIEKIAKKNIKNSRAHEAMEKVPVNRKKNTEDDFVADAHPEVVKKWKKFQELKPFMNEDACRVAMEDFSRLKSYKSPDRNTSEWIKYEARLDFNLSLPWSSETKQEENINRVMAVLDEDHHDLKHVKDTICDNVAPIILNPDCKGSILCFIGPPGVGKTSLGRSIARALNRKFIRVSLGGIHDEASVRGHRLTYIGSEPGKILREIQRCGVKNPVFMIDEIDKLGGTSVNGDPKAAMLEVLDPEQNWSFKDHYLDAGFNLSHVLFIATANVEQNIPGPLRDRMHIIRLPGYLMPDKVEIAKRFLISRWMPEVGLSKKDGDKVKELLSLSWDDGVLEKIIEEYTSEAGVRNLDRCLEVILKKITKEYLKYRSSGQELKEFRVTDKVASEFLGRKKILKTVARPTVQGEAIGLAWTYTGGDILYIESKVLNEFNEGKFVFSHTGLQGKVMEESTKVALSLIRERLADKDHGDRLNKKSIHIHVPEGAIPKDGPSAGVAFYCSLFSAVDKRLVKPYLGMTGEIRLTGMILPVGGIREKIVAAYSAGIKEVILPKQNERDLPDVPKDIRDKLNFHLVETIDEVQEIAILPETTNQT